MLPTLIFALITRVVSLNSKTVPVTSCCPEGSFLAIDELQGDEGRQYLKVSQKKFCLPGSGLRGLTGLTFTTRGHGCQDTWLKNEGVDTNSCAKIIFGRFDTVHRAPPKVITYSKKWWFIPKKWDLFEGISRYRFFLHNFFSSVLDLVLIRFWVTPHIGAEVKWISQLKANHNWFFFQLFCKSCCCWTASQSENLRAFFNHRNIIWTNLGEFHTQGIYAWWAQHMQFTLSWFSARQSVLLVTGFP